MAIHTWCKGLQCRHYLGLNMDKKQCQLQSRWSVPCRVLKLVLCLKAFTAQGRGCTEQIYERTSKITETSCQGLTGGIALNSPDETGRKFIVYKLVMGQTYAKSKIQCRTSGFGNSECLQGFWRCTSYSHRTRCPTILRARVNGFALVSWNHCCSSMQQHFFFMARVLVSFSCLSSCPRIELYLNHQGCSIQSGLTYKAVSIVHKFHHLVPCTNFGFFSFCILGQQKLPLDYNGACTASE